jgi:transposase
MKSWRQQLREKDQIIFSQQKRIEELESKFEKLEKYLKAFDNPHTPSSKKHKKSDKPKECRFPGKPPGSGGRGISMPPKDQTIKHSLDECPDCGNDLGNPTKTTVQKQIDLPEKLAICTEHVISHYHCKSCDQDISAAKIQGRYGLRMKSFVASLKEQGLSCQETALTLREMGFVSFSAATVVMVMVFFSQLLLPIRKRLEKEILKSSYIHSDETGLRKDGQSGYVWGFFTKGIALLNAEMSRGKHIAQNFLGKYLGVNVTDGYLGYADLVLRQRCWSHLIREFKELAKKHKHMKVLHLRIKQLYSEIKVYEDIIPGQHTKEYFQFELNDIVTCLNVHKSSRKLANLIKNGGDDWFTALDYIGVLFQNNLAERGLRRIVMHRKRMGCYRNDVGKNWIDVCLSVMQTWRLQNQNIFSNLVLMASRT